MKKKTGGCLIVLLFMSAVAAANEISQEKLQDVKLGMKQADIVMILGEPDRVKAEGLNAEGKNVESLEYQMAGVLRFPSEDARVVDERRIGQTSNDFSASRSREEEKGPTSYECALVMVNGVLARIQKRPVYS